MIGAREPQSLVEWFRTLFFEKIGIQGFAGELLFVLAALFLLFLFSFAAWIVSKKLILRLLRAAALRTKITWDDILVERKVFDPLAHLIPLGAVSMSIAPIFSAFPGWIDPLHRLVEILFIFLISRVLTSFVNAIGDILSQRQELSDKPINSFMQLAKLIIILIISILVLSILINRSPLTLLTGLGAMAAVLILIFKDTILGFVASVQLAANDMVRVGDWVEMPKYGADGDVKEINLTTIKIQNFDKTISTVPSYAFISDSFKNWRGMQDAEGRRIKRSIFIDMGSIGFAGDELIDRLGKVHLLSSYLDEKKSAIAEYNQAQQIDKSLLMNGRHQTNIGLFRAYVTRYLQAHPDIQHDMTCMVRQLSPSDDGLPIEVYAFISDKRWPQYESIVADIFDHLLAAVETFDLKIFQRPSGSDFNQAFLGK